MPFASAPAWHENQITRALLVVLRYSPIAHQAWLQLVSPGRQLQSLPPATFATQRQRVLAPHEALPEGEAIPGISVWLAPDAAAVEAKMKPTDRQQVLDAIITYGSELVVVIENKIGWGATTEQPHRINLHDAPVLFDEQPRSVKWQDVLGLLADLVERGLVHGAERLVISDFLDLVETHFPKLGPYSSLTRCGTNKFRIDRRLDAVQGEVVGTDEGKGMGWRHLSGTPKIFMAWLGYLEETATVSLHMYPADTLGQSRPFYADPASVQDVMALRSAGWRIRPHYHWGFMAVGYAWAPSPCSLEEYCHYWIEKIATTRSVERVDWPAYLDTLEQARILDAQGRQAFDQTFTASQRQTAQPRPGLCCEFSWPLADAVRLDDRGQLVTEVRLRINQMLAALRAPLLPGSPHSSNTSSH